MRNYLICPRPILKEKPQSQQLTISSLSPQPPTVHRETVAPPRVENTLTAPVVRVRKALKDAIDYAKLTATKQAAWDAGMYGSIEIKSIKGNDYLYLRWNDPETGKKRSTYLGKDWNTAIEKMKKLTGQI